MNIDEWTTLVYCPHGAAFRVPLRVFYALDTTIVGCGQCQAEAALPPPDRPGWFRRWIAVRHARRMLDRMEDLWKE